MRESPEQEDKVFRPRRPQWMMPGQHVCNELMLCMIQWRTSNLKGIRNQPKPETNGLHYKSVVLNKQIQIEQLQKSQMLMPHLQKDT